MTFSTQLDIYLRSRFTLLIIVTPEEERLLQTIKAVCKQGGVMKTLGTFTICSFYRNKEAISN